MTGYGSYYREFQTENGMQVSLMSFPTKRLLGRLRVFQGSLNEEPNEHGLNHLKEHTQAASGSLAYSLQESTKLKSRINYFNMNTMLDETVFYIGIMADRYKLCMEYLANMALNPRFDHKKNEEQKWRILREISDDRINPVRRDDRLFMEALLGKDSPINYHILGDPSVVRKATPDDLYSFHSKGFSPNNMQLILVGTLADDLEDTIHKTFGRYSQGDGTRYRFPEARLLTQSVELHTTAPDLKNKDGAGEEESSTDDEDQLLSAQLHIGILTPFIDHADNDVINLMANMLGAGTYSTLFQSVSEKNGLAYDIVARYRTDYNQGSIVISTKVDAFQAELAIEKIFEEFGIMQAKLVPSDIFQTAKDNIRYEAAARSDYPESYLLDIEMYLDHGITRDDQLRRLEQIRPQDIREAANKYLPSSREDGHHVLIWRDPLL